jgi:hypothetical protein
VPATGAASCAKEAIGKDIEAIDAMKQVAAIPFCSIISRPLNKFSAAALLPHCLAGNTQQRSLKLQAFEKIFKRR